MKSWCESVVKGGVNFAVELTLENNNVKATSTFALFLSVIVHALQLFSLSISFLTNKE